MAKSIIPFNYNEIYQQLAQKFIDKGYDAPYEGSNTGILTSIMAYAIQGLNFNTAMNINETLLSQCKKRRSAIQNARILSYEPTGKISNQIKIFIHPKRQGTLNIPKYQEFKINGYSYYYMGDPITKYILEDEVKDAGVWITVKQGTLLKYEDYPSVLQYSLSEAAQYIDIPFDDVEDDGLNVIVDTYDDYGNKRTGVKFTKKRFNLQDASDSVEDEYYRKDDLDTGNCRIYFRLGGLGKILKEGSKIYVDVLRSEGANANSESFSGSIVGDLSGFAEIIFEGDKRPQNYIYGQNEESIESIKTNAPIFFNTAGRCITEYDYKTFLKLQNAVLDGYAWGGEDELIPQVGRVYYSCIPNLAEPPFEMQELQVNKVKIDSKPLTDKDGHAVLDPITGEPVMEDIYEAHDTYANVAADSVGYFRKLNYDNNLYVGAGDIVSTIDTIRSYATPGLQNYIKNPLYIFADLNVSIKKYEYGAKKSEIHQKIFDCIKNYFDNRKGLNVNYVESTLIKQISDILGSDNGFTLDTLFSGYISDENKVQMISKDFDYNAAIVSYKSHFDGDQLTMTSYLNAKCSVGDIITYKLTQPASNGVQEVQEIKAVLTAANINQGEVVSYAQALNELDLSATWFASSGSANVKANEVPLSFKNIYYTSEVRSSVYTINALLNPSVKAGDYYDVFGVKDGILNKLGTKTIKQSDVQEGEVNYTYVVKSNDIIVPDDIFIRIAIKKEDNEYEYLESIKCASIEEAKSKLENDESTIYEDLAGQSAFLVTNTKQSKNNSYIVIMYLAKYMNENDTIEIKYGFNTYNYKLTKSDIQKKKASYTITMDNLDIQSVSYTSKSDIVMTVIKYDEYSADKLIPEADDRIQYSSEDSAVNSIEYNPSLKTGGQLELKSSFNCTFYRNFENKLDIRNLIVNYGNLTDYDEGKNPKVLNLDVQVSSYEGCDVKYKDFYVICTNPTRNSYVDVQVNMTTAGGVQFTNFRIPIKESANSAIQLSEGVGGIFLHLDIPPEGIYDDEGNLIISNLPTLYALGLLQDNELYNLSSMNQGNTKELLRTNTDLSVIVYVDTNKEDESVLKGMYPYYINEAVNASQADNTYKWIRFPIKASYGKQSMVIGTYVIVNSAKPYIRIKLKSEVVNLFDKCEFEIVYPSNNFSIIRNTALRLRSVNIAGDGENYKLRRTIKDSKDMVNNDIFSTWKDSMADEQSTDESQVVS